MEEQPEEEEQHAEEVDEAQPGGDATALTFDEELTWRPGKAIPLTTLLARLQRLFQELHDLDQESIEVDSLNDVANALGSRNLLAHKNEGVRALSAACIADMLRLSAPTAPFTSDQLKVRRLRFAPDSLLTEYRCSSPWLFLTFSPP